MEVTEELIDRLAHLSRLQFTTDEKTAISKDLRQMIAFVDKLNELNLESVPPLLHINDEVNVVRNDEVKGTIPSSDAFINAPSAADGFFKVPKVLRGSNPKTNHSS
jgi:aspartyl-tRNA(Asn)/glutamyl-tRNA(Gln) amidotransferase subunit C